MPADTSLVHRFERGDILSYRDYMSAVRKYRLEGSSPWVTPVTLETEKLLELAKEIEPDRVAVVGAGPEMLEALEDYVDAPVGTDVSREALQNYDVDADTVLTDCVAGLKDDSVDMLYAVNSLQAMDNPGRKLEDMKRVLDENGTAVVTAPTEDSATMFPVKHSKPSEEDYPEPPELRTVLRNGEEYSQYFFPTESWKGETYWGEEAWIQSVTEQLGLELERETLIADPRGIPYIYDAVVEEHRPDLPEELVDSLRQSPDAALRTMLENEDMEEKIDKMLPGPESRESGVFEEETEIPAMPKVEMWVMTDGA